MKKETLYFIVKKSCPFASYQHYAQAVADIDARIQFLQRDGRSEEQAIDQLNVPVLLRSLGAKEPDDYIHAIERKEAKKYWGILSIVYATAWMLCLLLTIGYLNGTINDHSSTLLAAMAMISACICIIIVLGVCFIFHRLDNLRLHGYKADFIDIIQIAAVTILLFGLLLGCTLASFYADGQVCLLMLAVLLLPYLIVTMHGITRSLRKKRKTV